jgi:hypothetical protein
MSPEDRKAFGQFSMADAYHKYAQGEEREFKRLAVNWLKLHGAYVFDQPMSKRTRGRRGTPDLLCCYRSYFLAIELKTKGETLRPEQGSECAEIRRAMGLVVVAYTLHDVIRATNALDKVIAYQGDYSSFLTDTPDPYP